MCAGTAGIHILFISWFRPGNCWLVHFESTAATTTTTEQHFNSIHHLVTELESVLCWVPNQTNQYKRLVQEYSPSS